MAGVKKVKEVKKVKQEGESKDLLPAKASKQAGQAVKEEEKVKEVEEKKVVEKEELVEKKKEVKEKKVVEEKEEEKIVEEKKEVGEKKEWLMVLGGWWLVIKKNWLVFGVVVSVTMVVGWLGLRGLIGRGEEPREVEIKTTYDRPEEGQLAPDFSLESTEGNEIKLSELEGEKVLVVLLSLWHPLCQDALKILETIYKKERGFVMVAIAVQEEKEVVADYLRRGAYSLNVYLDTTGEVGEKYQVTSMPSFYFIDSKRKFKKVFVGPLTREEILEAGRTL